MLNLENLWIGDSVKILSSGRIGTFEGIHKSGKARVKSFGKIYLTSANNLIEHEPKKEDPQIHFTEEKPKMNVGFLQFSDSIDLHIEKLNASLENALPERIIDYQIKAFLAFLDAAKSFKKHKIVIIHGRGAGVLKQIVQSTLKGDEQVFGFKDINNGGATEAVLNFF